MSEPKTLTPDETYALDRAHVFHSWSAQGKLDPMVFTDLTQLAVSVHCYRRQNPRQSEWIDTLS